VNKTVALIMTLDTKGAEAEYLRDKIISKGKNVIVLDGGILGVPQKIKADITREEIAKTAGTDLETLKAASRGKAVEAMAEGITRIIKQLYSEGKIHGILSVGGAEGTILGTEGMKALPVGVPKVMVSTMASGQQAFGEYTGTKDVMLMHSVIDILGINSISQKIFDNAIAAVVGMIDENVGSVADMASDTSKKRIAATMYGNTTPAVSRAKAMLEKEGYEVIVFHSNGTGGRAMEEFVEQGAFCGILDVTTHEIADDLVGGMHSVANRLTAGPLSGLPQLVVPGCVDWATLGALDELSPKFQGRPYYYHNRTCTLVTLSNDEIKQVGEIMAERLNKSKGPTKVAFPLRGLSAIGKEGVSDIFNPERDQLLLKTLKQNLRKDIELIEVDAHINDPEFVDTIIPIFLKLLKEGKS